MECSVDGVECHYDKSDNQGAFEQGENNAQKLVQPAEHHNLDCSFEKLPDGGEPENDKNKYQGKGNNLQDIAGCLDVIAQP